MTDEEALREIDLAEGNFGLVTYAQAKAMRVSIRELDRWVEKGRR